MSSPSPRKGKGREIEDTTPQLLDVTVDNTAENGLESILERMREWEKISKRNKQYRSYPWDKKAGARQTSTSPIEISSDNDYDNSANDSQLRSTTLDDSVDSDDGKDLDDLYLDDGEDVEILQPSKFRGLLSDEVPSASETKGNSVDMLQGTSDYADSEDSAPFPPKTKTTHSKFRQCGTDLMTRHMFSGRMNGKRPIYVPMYKRNKFGYLFRLKRNDKGRWEYKEVEKLTESESQARLKRFEDPKAKEGHSKLEDSKRPKTDRGAAGAGFEIDGSDTRC